MDIDSMVAFQTEGNCFHEYVICNDCYATAAVFDLKETVGAITSDHNRTRHAYQLSLCRALAQTQPVAPVFAYVVGDGPFLVYRVDLDSGAISDAPVAMQADAGSWLPEFDELGVCEIRQQLLRWLGSDTPRKG